MKSLLSLLPSGSLCILVVFVSLGCSTRVIYANREQQAQMMVHKGAAFLHLGMLEEASASFRVAAETAQIAGAYDGLGCVEFLRGNVKEARKLFHYTMTWFPNYIPVRANYALLLDVTGRKEEAEELYQSAITDDPMNYKVRNNYGMLLRSRNLKRLSDGFLADAYALSGHSLVKINREIRE